MADQSIQEKIMALEGQIALLPKGSVGKKTVNGKEYASPKISPTAICPSMLRFPQ